MTTVNHTKNFRIIRANNLPLSRSSIYSNNEKQMINNILKTYEIFRSIVFDTINQIYIDIEIRNIMMISFAKPNKQIPSFEDCIQKINSIKLFLHQFKICQYYKLVNNIKMLGYQRITQITQKLSLSLQWQNDRKRRLLPFLFDWND